jgi:HK97 family phage prohead protease
MWATRSTASPPAIVEPGSHVESGSSAEPGGPLITGWAWRANTWAEIGGVFLERFSPDAFTDALASHGSDVRAIFEHGRDAAAGNRPLGTIRTLRPDGYFEIEPLEGARYVDELLPGIRAGLFRMSFAFSPVQTDLRSKPGKSPWNARALPEVTVQKANLREISVTAFPAYKATSVKLY